MWPYTTRVQRAREVSTTTIAALLDNAAIRGIYVNRNNDGTFTIGSQSRNESVARLSRVNHVLATNGYCASWRGRILVVKG